MEKRTLSYLREKVDAKIEAIVYRPKGKVALYTFSVDANSWTSHPEPDGKLILCRRDTNPATYMLVLLGRTGGQHWLYHIVDDTRIHLDEHHPRIDLEDSQHPNEVFGVFFGNAQDATTCLEELKRHVKEPY